MTTESKDSQVSVRLPNELKDRMEAFAQLTNRSKSFVAVEALRDYLDWRAPQLEDLKAAVSAADRGEFASDDEVAAVLAAFKVGAPRRRAAAKSKPPRRVA